MVLMKKTWGNKFTMHRQMKKYLTILTIIAFKICPLFRMIVANGRHTHSGHGRVGSVVPLTTSLGGFV